MTTKPRSQPINEEHRAWLVVKWASYSRPSELLREFRDTFGIEISKQRAANYDLSNIRDEAHAKAKGVFKWWGLFKQARAEFEASISGIPIASATYRVKKLDEMFEAAFEKRNYKTAAQLLEQAARETGGMYTNKREIAGQVDLNHTHEDVPDDIKRSTIAQRVREAVAEALAAAAAPAAPAATTH